MLAVASTIPQMTVLGIAGPGDPLANPEKTFKTFRVDLRDCARHQAVPVHERPDASGSRGHDQEVQRGSRDHHHQHGRSRRSARKIYPWIYYKHKRYTGVEAARILTERQMQGLEMLTERGILCKVNSVMIPGVNDQAPGGSEQSGQIARGVSAQHHASDLGAGAWHGVRTDRPARSFGTGTEGAAG